MVGVEGIKKKVWNAIYRLWQQSSVARLQTSGELFVWQSQKATQFTVFPSFCLLLSQKPIPHFFFCSIRDWPQGPARSRHALYLWSTAPNSVGGASHSHCDCSPPFSLMRLIVPKGWVSPLFNFPNIPSLILDSILPPLPQILSLPKPSLSTSFSFTDWTLVTLLDISNENSWWRTD